MAKRNPYEVSYPERWSRDAVTLRVSGIDNPFKRGDTKMLMVTDDEAANLRADGWGVVSLTEPQSVSENSVTTSAPAPPPRRRRRRTRSE